MKQADIKRKGETVPTSGEAGAARLASSPALNRRSFFKAAAGIGAMTAAATLLPGCAPSGNTGGGAADAVPEGADGPGRIYSWLTDPPVIDDSEIVETVETDVVVVGGGNAGLLCACAVAEEGKTVAVIEMQAKESMTYWGLHDIASINPKIRAEYGLEEINKTEFLAEYQRRTHNKSNPALVKKFIDNSGPMIDWVIEHSPQETVDQINVVRFTTMSEYFAKGAEVNGFKCWPGYVQIKDFSNLVAPYLVEEAEASGNATWYWGHTGVVLITETADVAAKKETLGSDGKPVFEDVTIPQTTVKGVIAKNADGGYVKFLASKGVALTAGGYGGNPEMYESFSDEIRKLYQSHGLPTDDIRTPAPFGRDGSGIKMGMWAGGSIDPGPHAFVWPTNTAVVSENYSSNVFVWGAGWAGAGSHWGAPFMCVDSTGKRFTDEMFLGVFGILSQVERHKPGRFYYFFDNKWKTNMANQAPEHFSQPGSTPDTVDFEALFNSWVEAGPEGAAVDEGGTTCCWAANSLEELYEYMGLDDEMKANVQASIDRYNGFCEQGEDEDFARDPKLLISITEPPFFGMYSVFEKPQCGLVALNGLVIDENQRVLDSYYNPIVGLYASGNNSGGRFAVQYSTPMSGLTLGMAMTLGRELGKELAAL